MTLSENEQRVVDLMMEGMSGSEIAKELGISIRGVKFHKGNIFAKEGVSTSVQLIVKHMRENFVTKDEIKAFKEILK